MILETAMNKKYVLKTKAKHESKEKKLILKQNGSNKIIRTD